MSLQEVIEMNGNYSAIDVLGYFKKGFGREGLHDTNNAVYLATKLFDLDLPFKFRSKGRFGVVSFELCSIFDVAGQNSQDDGNIQKIGNLLSNYNSNELKYMALYLQNKARLYPDEIKEAEKLLSAIPKKT